MKHEWLGLADDLTVEGVVGEPYREPVGVVSQVNSTAYPSPPRHGGLKTLLTLAALCGAAVGVGLLTPPGQYAWYVIKTALLGSQQQPVSAVAPAATVQKIAATARAQSDTPPQAAAAGAKRPELEMAEPRSPALEKKPVASKRAKAARRSNDTDAKAGSPSETSPKASQDTEVDLEKYRNLTRGL